MEITPTLQSTRTTLLLTDHATYRTTLFHKIRTFRRQLGITSPKRGPYTPATLPLSKSSIHLLLLTSERAYAHAMVIKSTRPAASGAARKQTISKLHKAASTAGEITHSVETSISVGERDILEATAYKSLLKGMELFERRRWRECLTQFATARTAYSALSAAPEIVENEIDPAVKYAAYAAGVGGSPSTIAGEFFPSSMRGAVQAVQPSYFDTKERGEGVEPLREVTWQGRRANVDDSLGLLLAETEAAKEGLKKKVGVVAEDFDPVLAASADAADAVKRAIEELEREGLDEGDSRMQSLRVVDLKVNYQLVSWRAGRNRVLLGEKDGLGEVGGSRAQKVGRYRTNSVLLDAIVQGIEGVKQFRGAMRDEEFVRELDAAIAYFRAVRCAVVAASHAVLGRHANALALLSRAEELAREAGEGGEAVGVPTLAVSGDEVGKLRDVVGVALRKAHARVQLERCRDGEFTEGKLAVKKLETSPSVDLKKLVNYPVGIHCVPVKPIFLDIAWNYIDYPAQQEQEPVKEKKRGWFGFGR
ncbi:hypothetical protein K470DRAFT_245138 [Piedraia hortae CBS 480.64]|uniref:Signal recognition particle subunit SRP68 n=1 Tax=Piedraia hortae CBS 480.64 TaxID=1314780 RepID=A0A6A7C3V5_9PEZI|nr:hypothetical protein K470DRAFT_245138 [Piedraia hortae CBS 480.64]